MKKRWGLWICLLLCGCGPLQEVPRETAAAVVSEETQEAPWCYHYAQLATSLRPAYESLYAGMSTFDPQIVLEGITEADVETLFRAVIDDHPQLFYVDSTYRYRVYADGSLTVFPGYVYAEEQCANIQRQIDAVCDQILAELPDEASEEVAAAYLYAALIERTAYEEGAHDQQMDSLFLEGKSVCAGYARAYQYLMQKAGLFCTTISGKLRTSDAFADRAHAWNLLRLEDDWFYADLTSGDVVQYGPHTCYQYFKLSSQEAQRLYETATPLPQTADPSQSYFQAHRYYLQGYDETILQAAIDAMKARGDRVLELRTDPDQCEALKEALIEDDRIFALLEKNGIHVDTLGCAQMEALGSLELYY